jgi:succinate-semialdehyde dehydrogenase/glutarate-semialdehyde dehydrogenase
MTFNAINPFDNTVLSEHTILTASELDKKLDAATAAFEIWRFTTVEKRISCLSKMAKLLREQSDALAKTMTLEMGKLIGQAKAEIEKCAWLCDYYVEHAEDFLKPHHVKTEGAQSYFMYQPLGVILGIMPWNFPYWQVYRCAIPALMMGNTIVLKHALNVPQCALDIERLFREAGFLENTYVNLFLENDATTKLLNDPRIKAASLTGSDRAGRSVAAEAGKNIKKTVLELGGSDPFIVLDDVDIESVAEQAVVARFQNCGQSCIAAKRFIVLSDIAEDFTHQFKIRIEKLKAGNPLLNETTLGPMARFDLRDHLLEQVQKSISLGAAALTGGNKLAFEGAFFAATLLNQIPEKSPAGQEELFGPVASLFVAKDIEEAIKIANATPYGLGASVWTKDIEKGKLLGEQIQSGMVFVNSMVKSHPALPFGGVKQSGYGRELSMIGLHEFANCKTMFFG